MTETGAVLRAQKWIVTEETIAELHPDELGLQIIRIFWLVARGVRLWQRAFQRKEWSCSWQDDDISHLRRKERTERHCLFEPRFIILESITRRDGSSNYTQEEKIEIESQIFMKCCMGNDSIYGRGSL